MWSQCLSRFRLRDCPTPKGLAPPKCSGVFLLVADRTPSVIKILHGMRGRKHRLAKHPVSCRSRLSVRYWAKPLVHGWDKQEVERIAGFGYARQGTSRSDPCGAEVATTLGGTMPKTKEIRLSAEINHSSAQETKLNTALKFRSRLSLSQLLGEINWKVSRSSGNSTHER